MPTLPLLLGTFLTSQSDGVVGIVGFVGLLGIVGVVVRGEEKGAFGFESAAQILPDEDVSVGGEFLPAVRYPVGAIFLGGFVEVLLRGNAVGSAREQDG